MALNELIQLLEGSTETLGLVVQLIGEIGLRALGEVSQP